MRNILILVVLLNGLFLASCASIGADNATSVAAETDNELRLFAVEIKVGPNWDSSKAPNDQAFFSEHAANLKRHREAGHIVMGARYSDIGLIVFSAKSADDVKALMAQDPSIPAGTFKYQVHALNVFYPWQK
ncbi:MAG: hypothetical protein HKM98_04870 [Gammaproteobacteria bacterium]|nr:hypothetical protein [Gammaproteobacteria bacterium]